jgi:septum formation protein
MHFVLASSSQYRAQLIDQIKIATLIMPPNIDESPLPDEDPEELAIRLAEEKCMAVVNRLTENEMPALVIASDQVASSHQRLLGKPLLLEKAIQQLQYLSGKEAVFYTSLYLYSTKDQRAYSHIDQTKVKFRPLSNTEIEHYVLQERPFDCAGSFKCEGLGICLFESIESSDPSALIGLPLIALNKGLLSFGVNPLLMPKLK